MKYVLSEQLELEVPADIDRIRREWKVLQHGAEETGDELDEEVEVYVAVMNGSEYEVSTEPCSPLPGRSP